MKGRHFWAWTGFLTLVLLWPALAAAGAKTPVFAGGETHSLTVRADGSLWAWGDNSWGQLGLGDTADRNTPTRVRFPSALPGIYLLLLGN